MTHHAQYINNGTPRMPAFKFTSGDEIEDIVPTRAPSVRATATPGGGGKRLS
jgi:hypothetical protein